MITMEILGKIRRMYLRDKLSLHEITKQTGLSRNTIRRWLRRSEEVAAPRYRRREGLGKLAGFHAALEQALKADSHRAKQNRRTARQLFAQIKVDGYAGGYSRVTDFIRDWRGREGKAPHAFVPLSFELGEAFQFDWSEEGLVIGGIYRRIQLSHLKLCASRTFWVVAYPSQGHEMLFDAHTRAFAALGGIPRRGIYDNMKTAVDKVNKGKGRIVNARFAVMCAHYLFDPDFCNVASGWEKGVVEKNVQDSRRRIWLDAQSRRFGSFTELNVWLGERCRSLWTELRHPEHKSFSVADLPAPLKQLKLGLLRHAGGDRVMAQVLAAVPTAGLEAVLVAVELVIESGVLSAEHVLNVLARLNAGPTPEYVESSLQLNEAPLANTDRYDRLRGIDGEAPDVVAVDHA